MHTTVGRFSCSALPYQQTVNDRQVAENLGPQANLLLNHEINDRFGFHTGERVDFSQSLHPKSVNANIGKVIRFGELPVADGR